MGKLTLLIPLIGFGALGLLLFGDPGTVDRILKLGGMAFGSLFLVVAAVAIPRAFASSGTRVKGREGKGAGYRSPKIVRARLTPDGRGELEVSSSHAEHVARELSLPLGSEISIREKNESYIIHLPRMQARPGASQRDSDFWDVSEVAKANGFRGVIES